MTTGLIRRGCREGGFEKKLEVMESPSRSDAVSTVCLARVAGQIARTAVLPVRSRVRMVEHPNEAPGDSSDEEGLSEPLGPDDQSRILRVEEEEGQPEEDEDQGPGVVDFLLGVGQEPRLMVHGLHGNLRLLAEHDHSELVLVDQKTSTLSIYVEAFILRSGSVPHRSLYG